MADKIVLAADNRTEFGKGAARRTRAADKIPAVIYGHGSDPVHIVLPGHDTMLALKHSNALLNIKLPDNELMAIAKDVQRDAVTRIIEHVDLLLVRKGEKITVDVTVHLEGESVPGTISVQEMSSLSVLAEATHLPEWVEVSIEGLENGDKVLAGDVKLPAGSELAGDPEQLVVSITEPRQEVLEEEVEQEAAEGEEGDEGDAESGDEDAAKDDE